MAVERTSPPRRVTRTRAVAPPTTVLRGRVMRQSNRGDGGAILEIDVSARVPASASPLARERLENLVREQLKDRRLVGQVIELHITEG